MFYECESLKSLDVSGFDTSNIVDMPYMLYKCGSVESLDLSNFYTFNVVDMSYMLSYCQCWITWYI